MDGRLLRKNGTRASGFDLAARGDGGEGMHSRTLMSLEIDVEAWLDHPT